MLLLNVKLGGFGNMSQPDKPWWGYFLFQVVYLRALYLLVQKDSCISREKPHGKGIVY
nr:hypothetical protein Q903MT_gene2695 [Picea sitchensis]